MMTNEHWRSTTGLRTALVWLLSANVVATIATGFALLHHNQVVDEYHHFRTNYAATQDSSRLLGVAGLVLVAVFVATVVVFIVWMWRSAKNNELLDRVRPRYTPGWSIGGWFIPIGNLWIPVRIMHDLWQGADPETKRHQDWSVLRRTPLIGWWWGFYLASRVLTFTPVGVVCSVPAAILAIIVVRSITERQEIARTQLGSDVRAAAGWYADPTGRFDHRYWNGSEWTVHASRDGETTVDRL